MQLFQEAKVETLRDRASLSLRPKWHGVVDSNFEGQCGYYRNSMNLQKAGKTCDTLFLGGSFNCNDPGHMAKDCPKPKHLAQAAARKLVYLCKRKSSNAFHLFLAALCQEMVESKSFDDGEVDDVEIF